MRRYILATVLALAVVHPGPASAADEHHHAADASAGLSLNHGQKWIADQHTVDSVASMRSIVGKAPDKPAQTSLEELHAMGRQLQEGLQSLIRGCTMTGPAHEQLHSWISALAPEIEALTRSEKIETGRVSFDKIVELLQAFDTHFESKPQP